MRAAVAAAGWHHASVWRQVSDGKSSVLGPSFESLDAVPFSVPLQEFERWQGFLLAPMPKGGRAGAVVVSVRFPLTQLAMQEWWEGGIFVGCAVVAALVVFHAPAKFHQFLQQHVRRSVPVANDAVTGATAELQILKKATGGSIPVFGNAATTMIRRPAFHNGIVIAADARHGSTILFQEPLRK